MTSDTGKATSGSAMAISTWVTMRWELSAARVFTLGLVETHTMVNGSTALSMDMAFGKASQVIATSVSGSQTKLTATVSMSGLMAIATKANGSFV
jgi:hypothetical protein